MPWGQTSISRSSVETLRILSEIWDNISSLYHRNSHTRYPSHSYWQGRSNVELQLKLYTTTQYLNCTNQIWSCEDMNISDANTGWQLYLLILMNVCPRWNPCWIIVIGNAEIIRKPNVTIMVMKQAEILLTFNPLSVENLYSVFHTHYSIIYIFKGGYEGAIRVHYSTRCWRPRQCYRRVSEVTGSPCFQSSNNLQILRLLTVVILRTTDHWPVTSSLATRTEWEYWYGALHLTQLYT